MESEKGVGFHSKQKLAKPFEPDRDNARVGKQWI
jgi:hypothetical protein